MLTEGDVDCNSLLTFTCVLTVIVCMRFIFYLMCVSTTFLCVFDVFGVFVVVECSCFTNSCSTPLCADEW